MRFALFPFGSRGDVQPIVALGRTLRAQGHAVVLGAAPTFRSLVEDAGVEFQPTGGDIEGWMRTQGEALSNSPRRLLQELGKYIEADVPLSVAQTLEASAGADLIVGASLHQAAPSVAEHLGIPFQSLVYCPQTIPSPDWPPLNVPYLGMPRILNSIAWWSISLTMNRMARKPINAARAGLGLPAVDDVISHLRTNTPIVCADPPLAGPLPSERTANAGGPVATGALVVDKTAELAPELAVFLERGPPPLYVGFGSMGGHNSDQVTSHVITVARRLSMRVILAKGWGGVAQPKTPSPDVLFIEGAPHARLFPRCALVVHHGGAGTTTAAARAGVPQLVVAHAADQYFWGKRVSDLGVGPVHLRRPKLGAATLHARLAGAFADDVMAARAQALATELAKIDGNARTAELLVRRAAPRM